MIKFEAIVKETWERKFIQKVIFDDAGEILLILPPGYLYSADEVVLVMGVEIGGVRHNENDVYRVGACYYALQPNIYHGWQLMPINYGCSLELKSINEIEKVGHLWSRDKNIREVVKGYNPEVYSLMRRLGKFSEVMK